MTQVRFIPIQLEQDDVFAALQYAPSFHCLVEEWKDCGGLGPTPQGNWTSVNRKLVCSKKHMSVNEMRTKQQKKKHENASNM